MHHRSHCDGRRSINDGAGGRRDADAGVSGHGDRHNAARRWQARAGLHGHHHQLHGSHRAGWDFPLKITSFDETGVLFKASGDTELTFQTISGSIDRVTGDMKAVSTKMNKNTFISLDVAYFLKCRPAQRMF
jgi:hypothetical protein